GLNSPLLRLVVGVAIVDCRLGIPYVCSRFNEVDGVLGRQHIAESFETGSSGFEPDE
ncbi:unnamed protein product, partial [marine sediment metagenome]